MNPAKEYPDAALQTHQDQSLLLRENMQVRAEVVSGVANEEQMKIALGPLLEEFILWDKQETTLHTEFSNVKQIIVCRIIIFVRYPQHLYHNDQVSAANKVDAQLEVATAIVEVSRIDFILDVMFSFTQCNISSLSPAVMFCYRNSLI